MAAGARIVYSRPTYPIRFRLPIFTLHFIYISQSVRYDDIKLFFKICLTLNLFHDTIKFQNRFDRRECHDRQSMFDCRALRWINKRWSPRYYERLSVHGVQKRRFCGRGQRKLSASKALPAFGCCFCHGHADVASSSFLSPWHMPRQGRNVSFQRSLYAFSQHR